MTKSSGRSLFGRLSRPGTVTVIEAPVRADFRRRARITFFVVAFVVFLAAATVASHYLHPILGLLLGLLVGVAVAAPVSLLVWCWPVLRVFWRWSVEIVLLVGLVYGWVALNTATALWVSLLVVALLVGVPAAVGPARRWVSAWVMCLVVRHRLRLCFAAFIVANRQGSLPLILAARPTPAGERVWVWLRPGLAISDLEGRTDRIAVACWANEVRVVRASARYAALLRVDVTRRDALAGRVASPLAGLVPDDSDRESMAPTSPGMPRAGLDLPDVPDRDTTAAAGQPSGIRRTRAGTSTAGSASSPVDNPRHFGADNAEWA